MLVALWIIYRFWDMPLGLAPVESTYATMAADMVSRNILTSLLDILVNLVNLPWLALQAISIKLLGVSELSVRLPGILSGALSVGLFVLLIKRLINPGIALLGGVIMVSSAFMLSIARSGTPTILLLTLLLALILVGANMLKNKVHALRWHILLGAISGLLCYMAGGVYLILILGIIALVHPKTRYQLLYNKFYLLGNLTSLFIITLPLAIMLIIDIVSGNYNIVHQLLLADMPSVNNWLASINLLFGFSGEYPVGFINSALTFTGCMLALLGLIIWLPDRLSARNYLAIGLFIFGLTFGFINPALAAVAGFLGLIILQIGGLDWLMQSWYGLFPNNPYARVFGILPIIALLGVLCSSDVGRYFYSVNYDIHTVCKYDMALPALSKYLANHRSDSIYLIVPADKINLYRHLSHPDISLFTPDSWREHVQKHQSTSKAMQKQQFINATNNNDLPLIKDLKLVAIQASWLQSAPVLYRAYQQK